MSNPRLLLFGTPGAGKTSLLGALAQAAVTQAPLLKGQLVDVSGELHRLHAATYVAKMLPTDVLESYDIRLQSSENGSAVTEATLLDCSGKSALEMLKAKEPFADSHPMKKPILDADAVLLLVDASMPGKQLAEEFNQFARWLTDLHALRGRRTDIAELPVYVVLTKCDLLVKKDDTASKWMERIEEAKRRVDERLRKTLKEQGAGFGTIDLRLWATAIKRPALADRPAKADEPYGVAELFRQCLQSAADFLERRQTSQSRLWNVVVGLMGLVAILVLGLAFLVEFQPDTKGASLDEKVQRVLPKKDANPQQRLGGTLKKLQERRKKLADIEKDDAFDRLPQESRAAVQKYKQEIDAYLQLSEEFKTKVKFPFLAKTDKEYVAQEKNLRGLSYPADWQETQLGRRGQQCLKEYDALNKALAERETWIGEQIKSNNVLLDQGYDLQLKLRKKLKLEPQEADVWNVKYRDQMQARPPALQSDTVPGVSSVTYEFLDKFPQIKDARKKWDAVKLQLGRVAENIQDELRAGT